MLGCRRCGDSVSGVSCGESQKGFAWIVCWLWGREKAPPIFEVR
jgi:hypothetical protein